MKLAELEYYLPRELIAQKPARPRDRSRLLVLDRKTGRIQHRRFNNIVDYLNKGDILVLNNTKVIPCRLIAQRPSGGVADILLVKQDAKNSSLWIALVNFNRRLREKETLSLVNNDSIKISLLKRLPAALRPAQAGLKEGWQIKITPAINIKNLEKIGKMPLPPYIKRPRTDDRSIKSDKECYQTVYADKSGSIAAPTAGLHFTRPLISKLIKKGVRIVYITLHVGIGTFKTIKTDNIEDHRMEQEYFEVSPETTRILLEAYRDKKMIIAVGTTACRVLETIAGQVRMLMVHPWLEKQRVMRASLIRGWTDLFIHPPYQFNLAQALVTNFHLPHGTPLALVCAFAQSLPSNNTPNITSGNGQNRIYSSTKVMPARAGFAGRDLIMDAYQQAMDKKYRFYSYGDAMLIL